MSIGTQRMTIEQYRDAPKRRDQRKYRNEPTVVGDIRFDSKAEAKRWFELQVLQREGLVSDLQRQVRYQLIPATARPSGGKERPCDYIADFVYVDARSKETVCEDVKGAITPEFRIKRKLMLWVHGIEIREVKA